MSDAEALEGQAEPKSTFVSGYLFPSIILIGLWTFSAVIGLRVPEWFLTGVDRNIALGLMPMVSTLAFIGARLLLSRPERQSELLICWLLLFLWIMHTVFLAFGIGLVTDLVRVIPVLTSLLFLVLGLIVAQQPHKSIFGIRTRTGLANAQVWRSIHRRFGLLMTGLTLSALILSLLGLSRVAMAALAIGPFVALGLSVQASKLESL